MEDLDFGWGAAFLLIAAASIYMLVKGLVMLLIYYIPAQFIYQRFLKTNDPSTNLFRAFTCWAISIFLLRYQVYWITYPVSITVFDEFLRDCNSGLYSMYFLFFQFLFWKYAFDNTTKRIMIIAELSWGKKLLNFMLFYLLLLITGFFIQPFMEIYDWSRIINYPVFFILLLIFLLIRNRGKLS